MEAISIRKISIGPDYKNALHYVVGQTVLSDHKIHLIQQNVDYIDVWIQNPKGEILLWKKINNKMPICVEANIDF